MKTPSFFNQEYYQSRERFSNLEWRKKKMWNAFENDKVAQISDTTRKPSSPGLMMASPKVSVTVSCNLKKLSLHGVVVANVEINLG